MASDDAGAGNRTPGEIVADGLAAVARARFPGAEGVSNVTRLTAGATQEIWRFDLRENGVDTPLILRRSPGGLVVERPANSSSIGLDTEGALLRLVEDAGAPVPHVRHILEPADGLGQGFIMTFVAGETLGGRIVRDARFAEVRPKLARQCGEILARIHAIPASAAPHLKHSTAAELVDQWRTAYEATEWPRPVFELAFRWLGDHLPPPPAQARLVHGDFRNGNLIFDESGVAAVLDWELAHVGDPMEDMGWICTNCWRFGQVDKPVGGFGRREDMWEGYEAAGGDPVSRAHALFWEVFGSMRWGVMCAGMIPTFRANDSVERGVIARRASENEIDLMRLLAGRGAD
ncbi:MAG TPA: phosphotransferase family protein [Caulobacteraceae bacterium]|jgi:aminoglycoside phosphotransferase (APT) family kinase protein|nr:phosphotransferase family protein [Caulobacteraceae bacterium]